MFSDLKKQFMLDKNITYLNHGSFGACSKVSYNNLLNWHPKKEIDDGIKSIIKLFKKGIVKNYRDINYYNIRRLISHLNI